uniref:Uncharacterized protein n=1 Tax=Candidatus Kentrum sp. FM TaxID=2126340 RepID=A0A450SJ09_9GAMM|nr:MAG: hypothetical protein BECKFM1743A_GA0114220_101148 [Candidatus Kentron sp. FM]VFJ54603.1 MAG: hypothetical protein BECKFM1743C_GA0114222_101418 [Candidatus Kentron sp. FM]VFK10377.1 MAG: hypothetical protein BECKFM1743B_GA0114221_101388 [Candidatus Kentron sp. FM]
MPPHSGFRGAVLAASRQAVTRLGEPVTLAGGTEIPGIFTYPSEHSEFARTGSRSASTAAIKVQSRNPTLIVLEEDAGELRQGSRITVRGKNFDIAGKPRPDGNGKRYLDLVEGREEAPGDPDGPVGEGWQ